VTDTSVQKFQVRALIEMIPGLVIQIGKKTHHSNSTHSAHATHRTANQTEPPDINLKAAASRSAHHEGRCGVLLNGHPVIVEMKGRRER